MFNINHSVHNPICKIHLKERLATPWNGAVGDTLLQQELLGILPLEMALSNWKWPIWPSINCFSSEDLRSAIVNKHLSHLFWSYSAICSLFEAVFKISDSCLQRRRNWGLICTYQLSPASLCLKNKRLQKSLPTSNLPTDCANFLLKMRFLPPAGFVLILELIWGWSWYCLQAIPVWCINTLLMSHLNRSWIMEKQLGGWKGFGEGGVEYKSTNLQMKLNLLTKGRLSSSR